ncbi:MAG TPA: hypothetical protein VNO81_13225 [Candidatus Nitrosotenuis sp.]|jgi:uncharacterized membrane protein|nr:hypothetical protein [Candidatus Nitrosotenuis sp.]
MNPTHLHLLLNHVPLLGLVFGILLLAGGALRRSEELKKAGLVFLCLAALVAVPVNFSGEAAEEGVERLPGVEESYIERHEEAAKGALAAVVVVGVAAAVALVFFRGGRPVPGWLVGALLLLALAAGGLMARAANLGGQIRHTEIRQPGGPAPASYPATQEED